MNNEDAIAFLNADDYESAGYGEAIAMAIKSLEKRDKYRWHDLRKDPNDLPLKNGNTAFTTVFVKMRHGFYAVAFYYNRWNGYTGFFYHGLPEKDIIAWREIEPFEEVEDAEIQL